MKETVAVKDKFINFKSITKLHFISAVLFSFLTSVIAVMRIPLISKTVSMVNWILIFLPALTALFIFYASIRKPKRTVFLFLKRLYYLCSPFILVFITDLFFDPNKANIYSERFWGRFFPIWIAIWGLGIAALIGVMRGIEYVADKCFTKDGRLSRFFYDFAVMYTPQKVITKQKSKGKAKWFVVAFCMLMVALAVFLFVITLYLHSVYSNMEFEAILFTVTFASSGLATEDLIAGFTLFLSFAVITGYFCYHLFKCFTNEELVVENISSEESYTLVLDWKKRAVHIVLSVVFFVCSVGVFSSQTEFMHYINMKSNKSSIYDNYYVEPNESVISFPEKKRNLIYIFLESMENTYASKEIGGSQDTNYILGLSEIAKDKNSVNFSNTEQLGGASVFVPAISHTMGSTIAQTSGISTNTELSLNSSKEFPAMVRLEDILHDAGYNQLYIEGAKGEFSMYDKYVGRYEDSKVYDRKALVELGYADEKADYIWKWGIEDQKLIEITKELITEMSQKDKPFFVTMYTMDTHTFECGHPCKNCDTGIGSEYLACVDCSSRTVTKFVEWIKQQPFYENTTVILVGDHLGNKKTTKVNIDDDYVRTTYNCFINAAKQPANAANRVFSSLDMFPTTLSAIGVEIRGDRLGLGTDLFSETPTLSEELGEEVYKEQLERSSDYWEY